MLHRAPLVNLAYEKKKKTHLATQTNSSWLCLDRHSQEVACSYLFICCTGSAYLNKLLFIQIIQILLDVMSDYVGFILVQRRINTLKPAKISSERFSTGDAFDMDPRLEAQKASKKSGCLGAGSAKRV